MIPIGRKRIQNSRLWLFHEGKRVSIIKIEISRSFACVSSLSQQRHGGVKNNGSSKRTAYRQQPWRFRMEDRSTWVRGASLASPERRDVMASTLRASIKHAAAASTACAIMNVGSEDGRRGYQHSALALARRNQAIIFFCSLTSYGMMRLARGNNGGSKKNAFM